MNKAQVLVIALFAAIPFFAFLAFPNGLVGTDPFYFYAITCNNAEPNATTPMLSASFFQIFPCDLILFKSLFFILILISSLIVAKTGELFNKDYGWLAGILVFLSSQWTNQHMRIEDDVLAYPILFLANYFFIKGELEKSNGFRLIAVALIIFTGLFMWRGALLYLLAYSFFWLISTIITIAILLYIGFGALNQFLPNVKVVENKLAIGLGFLGLGHGLAFLGLYGLTRGLWLLIPFLLAGFINAKFAIHAAPLLAIGLMFLVLDLKKIVRHTNIESYIKNYFTTICIGIVFIQLIVLSIMILFAAPHTNQMEAVQDTIALAKQYDTNISNDWSYGYYFRYYGAVPLNEGGGDYNSYAIRPAIVLTEDTINQIDYSQCNLIKNYGKGFNYELKTYKCG